VHRGAARRVRDGTGGLRLRIACGAARRLLLAAADPPRFYRAALRRCRDARLHGTHFSIVHPANPAVTRISFYRQPGGFFSSYAPPPPGDAHARTRNRK